MAKLTRILDGSERFSSDCQTPITIDDDGTARPWDLNIDHVIDHMCHGVISNEDAPEQPRQVTQGQSVYANCD